MCMCVSACLCVHTQKYQKITLESSKIDLLNNHPLYNFEQFICNFFSK